METNRGGKELAELAGSGELDLAEYRAAKAANDAKIEKLCKAVARSAEQEAQERARSEAVDLWSRWDEIDIESRRRMVQALAERIEVAPAPRSE